MAGFWRGHQKKICLKGGAIKKNKGQRGGGGGRSRKIFKYYFKMGYVLLFLKKYVSPQKQTKKIFKSIRDAPSAFNNVSTATDPNFKLRNLKGLGHAILGNFV